jgi:glutathione peroxidase-family protein
MHFARLAIALPLLLATAGPGCAHPKGEPMPAAPVAPNPTWYQDLALVGIDGQPLPAEAVAGKVVLFVNVASKCGFTPQYDGLQKLWQTYKDRGFVIVGVPCNQFGGQEPGSSTEIASFCRLNYGVDFPLLEKQDVNGTNRSKLYAWLVGSPAGDGSDVKWNFEKFLVGRDGRVIDRWRSMTGPDSDALKTAIEAAL